MKPSALEVKRVKAQEAQSEMLAVLGDRLGEISAKLDAIMAALKIGEAAPQAPPVTPAKPAK